MLRNLSTGYFDKSTFNLATCSTDTVFVSCENGQYVLFVGENLDKKTLSFTEEGNHRCVGLDCTSLSTNTFMTCLENGTVSVWDLRDPLEKVSSSSAGQNHIPVDCPFTCGAISRDGRVLCGGTDVPNNGPSKSKKRKKSDGNFEEDEDDGCFIVSWDSRYLKVPISIYTDIHSDTVNAIHFDPSDSHRILSCSDDGLVCITDLSVSLDDSLIEVFNSECPNNLCGWLDSHGVYCLSNMQTQLSMWPLLPQDEVMPSDCSWRQMKGPKKRRTLLTLALLQTDELSLSACILATNPMTDDLRAYVAHPGKSNLLVKQQINSKESDLFYASFLAKLRHESNQVIIVGTHSIHRLELNLPTQDK